MPRSASPRAGIAGTGPLAAIGAVAAIGPARHAQPRGRGRLVAIGAVKAGPCGARQVRSEAARAIGNPIRRCNQNRRCPLWGSIHP